ncbi:EscU/YscU/HrcU family type III secretion system export apparatus switch protein [Acetobacter sacchari]|uniref:EscU/YscU/HrcU family type III secretion system export apparatus switch protein n=1 Tax=Acetobacter sacchari TaxID=2661687 RepID=A0ABS3LX15_9PROT|nr:EscU/YscU/HrcU family type III secretion system export apparatus switch protein [Acetobacter sacchari]MBO1360449.1 EscU/YscU/HrcU family type III secretion system export apparatus switch protein [Acetobacter sacchari]
MSVASSEEKSLPASARKLANQRKKGHVARAPEMQSAIVSITLMGWLVSTAPSLSKAAQDLFQTTGQALQLEFPVAINTILISSRTLLLHFALLPLSIAFVAAFLAGFINNRGFIFALTPVVPTPDKINPLTGFKNLFKINNFVDLGMAVLKAFLFGAALIVIGLHTVDDLMRVPELPLAGLPSVLHDMLLPMIGPACGCYLVFGIVDMLIKRALFLKEMRMTQTEAKNERKDMTGNPQIKRQRHRLAAENRRNPARIGPARATLMICCPDLSVGLRYKPGETSVPRIVCIGRAARSADFRRIAHENRTPICWDQELAQNLAREFKPGMTITQAYFTSVARVIQTTPPP